MENARRLVLIVDDDEISCKQLKKMLEPDYRTRIVHSGREALHFLETEPQVSAMLLDVTMPEMDGFAVLSALEKRHISNLPVLMLTACNDAKVEQKALDLGAWDFIVKPAMPDILRSRLRNAIARSRMGLLAQLEHDSLHDKLTGLPNRTAFCESTRRLLDKHPDRVCAMVRFDMDRFGQFNSIAGDDEGDKLLCCMAGWLREMAAAYSFSAFGRIAGDVFGLCVPFDAIKLEQQVYTVAGRMSIYREDALLEPSFGIYVITDTSQTVEQMMAMATTGARKCKGHYRQYIGYFDAASGEAAQDEARILNEMQTALEQEQFLVFLQPKYSLANEQPCGAEALVRWQREDGLVSPGAFIPIFEKNGFIARLDFYMWEHTCALLRRWLDAGYHPAPISVNVSRGSLYNLRLAEDVTALVKKYNLPPSLLQLEITESTYMSNPDLMRSAIEKLHAAGFSILMDDFGSGYSSLNTLREIDIDILKIDMMFLPTDSSDGKAEKILTSVIRMAGWLGMDVVVEGVETKAQRDFLLSVGCGFVQGFYYARPMPAELYETMLNSAVIPADPLLPPDATTVDAAAWSADPKVTSLLKMISIPLMIFEYTPQSVQLLRVNEAFLDTFGTLHQQALLENRLSKTEQAVLHSTFAEAIGSDTESTCAFSHTGEDGVTHHYRFSLQQMSRVQNAYLLCGTLSDVTEEYNTNQQLQLFRQSIQKDSLRHKLLVVDDDEVSRLLLSRLLGQDYEVIAVQSGEEGLALLQGENKDDFCAILLDMIMPGVSGTEFLRRKKLLDPEESIPVIVISADSSDDSQRNTLQQGVRDYITKPFIPDLMRARVFNAIAGGSAVLGAVREYTRQAAPPKAAPKRVPKASPKAKATPKTQARQPKTPAKQKK